MGMAPSHKPSSRAQFNSGAGSAGGFSDEEQKEGGGGAGSGPGSGQSSDNDEEVIRVARPLAAKNKLLHRAAGLAASREFPSPKLGPRSLGTSPAGGGMGPRGVSAPNNQQSQAAGQVAGASAAATSSAVSSSSSSARAPGLVHAASTGSTSAGLLSSLAAGGASEGMSGLHPSLTAPPSLSSASSSASDSGEVELDLPPLPEPSASLGAVDAATAGEGEDEEPFGAATAAAASSSSFVLTEPGELGKEHQISEKEALGIPEGDVAEEKDLVDEALEKRPDPLAKLRQEVILPVTASPKQFRSSQRLLTLAAESAHSADGTVTPPSEDGAGAEANPSSATWAGHRGLAALATGISPTAAASGASGSSLSPLSSANNTPKPAFLRRLDSPESHHGQLIAAKARLQLLISRAVQTVPNLKLHAFPAAQQRLQAALTKLEHSTIQP